MPIDTATERAVVAPLDYPAAAPLAGPVVTLEPTTREGLVDLAPVLRRTDVFAGGWGGGPAGLPDDDRGMVAFLERYLPPTGRPGRSWVARLAAGPHAGRAVGTSSFLHLDAEGEAVEIGCTAYDPRVWGSAVNPATKLLLFGLAFASGFHRVALNADARNARSCAAIERLGATREGVLRRHRRRADGSWRDTIVHSVLASEWPDVRERLEERIRNAPPIALDRDTVNGTVERTES